MSVANTIYVNVMSHRHQRWRSPSNNLLDDSDLTRELHSASLRAVRPSVIENGWKLTSCNDHVPRQCFASLRAARPFTVKGAREICFCKSSTHTWWFWLQYWLWSGSRTAQRFAVRCGAASITERLMMEIS